MYNRAMKKATVLRAKASAKPRRTKTHPPRPGAAKPAHSERALFVLKQINDPATAQRQVDKILSELD